MEKVACVVVDAAPAGSACAIMAGQKRDRDRPGRARPVRRRENVASFVLFANVLETIIPNYREEAPLDRIAADTGFVCLLEKDYVEFRAKSGHC